MEKTSLPTFDFNGDYLLLGNDICPYCQRARLALLKSPDTFNYQQIDFHDKPDWLSTLSPLGKIPVLITEQGVISESDIIVSYLDQQYDFYLSSDDGFTRAKLMAWVRNIDYIHDLIRQYFLSPNESYSQQTKQLVVEKIKYFLNFYQEIKVTIDSQYSLWAGIFLHPLMFLIDTFSQLSGVVLVQNHMIEQHRDRLTNCPNMKTVFTQDVRNQLIKFLQDNSRDF